jgi:hypothetical protein
MSHVQFQLYKSRQILLLDFTEAYIAEQFTLRE